MAVVNVAFSGGVAALAAYGQRDKIRFVGTWVAGDTWKVQLVTTLQGTFTLGAGNIANHPAAVGFKMRNRMYIGIGDSFALSANGDVTKWEQQDIGAAKISYISQFGVQDEVKGLVNLQGRLAVLARHSIQIWSIDADPANMILQQAIDNTGTNSPLSVKAIGDLDALYLDFSGVRSLRANNISLNASIDDVGTAIDLTVRLALVGYDATLACAIVEPTTRQYWLYLNGTIYVLSKYPESKIIAWSTYDPTYESTIAPDSATYNAGGFVIYSSLAAGTYYWTKGANDTTFSTTGTGAVTLSASGSFVVTDPFVTGTSAGVALAAYTGTLVKLDTAFTPTKFVIYNNQVYARSTVGNIMCYGGSGNATYDRTQATIELPWLDFRKPSRYKQVQGVDAAFSGNWMAQLGFAPRQTTLATAINRGSAVSPSMVADSTYDLGHFGCSGHGTHIKIKFTSGLYATAAKLGQIIALFSWAEEK